jgi:hypothetical protein
MKSSNFNFRGGSVLTIGGGSVISFPASEGGKPGAQE